MNGARDIRRGPHFVFIAPVAPLQNHVLILKQPCDTLYSRFQNRLGLATIILAVSKIVWALRRTHRVYYFIIPFRLIIWLYSFDVNSI